ncbi:hypothetical protein CRT60_21955 [Azospirillum palustre]|uniref:Zinc ribbon domain-containing protein n=1 Tax=Azospirillum palustre TaxID=2044885 RepID=A0A2B8BF88_9PROT|nr:hypothetical protein [Azospirillum palustre]PGH55917.1 hypothetical protein CRT60_21955 [Azospirillum palustre]
MILLGLFGLLAALAMDTSVSTGIGSRVENIGLLSRQSNGLIGSGLLFMTGCILIGLAAVRDAVDRLGTTIAANAPRTLPPVSQRPAPISDSSDTQPRATIADATKTCSKCYALASAAATKCMRCGTEFQVRPIPKNGDVLVGSRVRHPSFGEGEIEAVDGDTAMVRFDKREKPEPMNMSYLTFVEKAAL